MIAGVKPLALKASLELRVFAALQLSAPPPFRPT